VNSTDSGALRRGTAWVGVASALSGVLDLVSTLVCLWLWVSPADLGIATMAGALFPVLDRLAQLGLGSAVVRQVGEDRRELSSIWWTSFAMSLVVFAAAIVAGPAIAGAFGHPIIAGLMAGYAFRLVTQNTHLVPEALLRRELAFDTLSKIRIAASIADTLAKLGTAYAGAHGNPDLKMWCFVVGPVVGSLVTSLGALAVRPWWPAFAFDRKHALAALGFGGQLSLADLLYFAYTSADYIVIGRVFGDVAVGAYRLAYEMVLDVVRLVSMVTAEVAFPAFARLGGKRDAAGELLIRFTRQNLALVAPVLVVIGVAAPDLLAILYPPLPPSAATAARILCAVGALRAASFVLPAMLAGLGHSRDALVYNVVAAIACPTTFAIAASVWRDYGYVSVAWAWAASYPLAFAVVLAYALERTGLSLATYLRRIAPLVGIAAATTAVALAVYLALPPSPWIRVLAVAAIAAASYAVVLVRGGVARRLIDSQ
jgi:O-antigen/teichoic acid export membrane protein